MNLVIVGVLGVFVGMCGGIVVTSLMAASSSTNRCEECVFDFSGHKKDEPWEACSHFVSDYVIALSELERFGQPSPSDCKLLAYELLERKYPKEDRVESLMTE